MNSICNNIITNNTGRIVRYSVFPINEFWSLYYFPSNDNMGTSLQPVGRFFVNNFNVTLHFSRHDI